MASFLGTCLSWQRQIDTLHTLAHDHTRPESVNKTQLSSRDRQITPARIQQDPSLDLAVATSRVRLRNTHTHITAHHKYADWMLFAHTNTHTLIAQFKPDIARVRGDDHTYIRQMCARCARARRNLHAAMFHFCHKRARGFRPAP